LGLSTGQGPAPVWVVVLIKGFDSAKQRLKPALDQQARRSLAVENAERALRAARAGDQVLAVCGSPEAAELARSRGAEVLLEERPAGQNAAASRGIDRAEAGGAAAVVLLSSDLPLVSPEAVTEMISTGRRMGSPAALAAAATGRGGTNALYLSPPGAVGLHFGEASLEKFAGDAAQRGVPFEIFESSSLALDLDEPSDLEALRTTL
jgi:2-phospho-L-lactate/phosphoenolpyruvate guanylyltransferase